MCWTTRRAMRAGPFLGAMLDTATEGFAFDEVAIP